MNKKITRILVLLIALSLQSSLILATEHSDSNEYSGQSEIIYIANKNPSFEEVEKGDGIPIQGVNTGDSSITRFLEVMVITSMFLLMLIIFIRKGEQTYEKNKIYECIGNNNSD